MGGRGSSSGVGGGGIDVTHSGKTTRYYFSKRNGVNYYQKGIRGTPEPTPRNMSAKEFSDRVKANGATVKAVSQSARKIEEKAYKADRKATNSFLNQADAKMGGNGRDQRMATKGRRGGRRGI